MVVDKSFDRVCYMVFGIFVYISCYMVFRYCFYIGFNRFLYVYIGFVIDIYIYIYVLYMVFDRVLDVFCCAYIRCLCFWIWCLYCFYIVVKI